MRSILVRAFFASLVACMLAVPTLGAADDLPEVQKRGTLRHLSIPYANFNTGSGDGLDVELMKRFAAYLGVKYEHVESNWGEIIGDLTGKVVKPKGNDVEITGEHAIRGDVIANGFTVLPWRQKVVAYSSAIFPTQVWLVVNAASPLKPIVPGTDVKVDIAETTKTIKGLTVLGKSGTCLDPGLYNIEGAGAMPKCFAGGLNDLAPALLKGEADALLLDVPDSLVALRKWPGKIKVIGPMSEQQEMACAFRPESPKLRAAFETFLAQCRQDGVYLGLIRTYYPDVFSYYPEFFRNCREAPVPAKEPMKAAQEKKADVKTSATAWDKKSGKKK